MVSEGSTSIVQQFGALYWKNVLVAWRSRRSTLIRLLAPFFFLILALIIKVALEADDRSARRVAFERNPEPFYIDKLPSCNSDLFIGEDKKCYDFFYTPVGDPVVEGIVERIRQSNNPPIPTERVRGFESRKLSDEYFLRNPDTCLGAVHFIRDNTGNLNFIVQSNSTVKYFKGEFQDPSFFFQLPMVSAAQREIVKHYISERNGTQTEALTWRPVLVPFPHPALETNSILAYVLGPFIFAACMFGFVTQMGSQVGEKELGLRQALRNMGMKDSAYWASWALFDATLAMITAVFICVFGMILQFRYFLENSFAILLLLFWLFQMAMSAFSYFLSSMMKKGQTAVYVGFFIFLVGWIFQTVVAFGVPYRPRYRFDGGGGAIVYRIFNLLPWNPFTKAVLDLGAATNSEDNPGLKWSQRNSYCQYVTDPAKQEPINPREVYRSYDCVLPVGEVFIILIVQYACYLVLAVYLDQVIPNESGVSRPLWFIFNPSYWMPRKQVAAAALKKVLAQERRGSRQPPQPVSRVDDDVAAEEKKMRELINHRTGTAGQLSAEVGGRNAVELYGLKKVFRQRAGTGCCSGNTDFWAICGSWFSIAENQLFCLLGPNGAGKTTTINCLTGVLPATGGDALVYGQSIKSEGGMDYVRSIMGVCPQFDVLWPELTGEEHLTIYGHVKGVKGSHVKKEAAELLEKVKLTYAARQRSGAYSGGMKRRLSVAIALLGDPKIVYLDEPTTGMDPISRRYVWDIIQESKAGRAIVLTTHSMEEADILGDRIAIMARGRVRCIGSSLRLKQKFGAGYQVSISVMPSGGMSSGNLAALEGRALGVKRYFKTYLGEEPVEESKAYITYLVGRDKEEQLNAFLKQLDRDRGQLGLTDIQLSLTSLEEVFLTIAKEAELDAAAREGKTTMDVTVSDGTTLQVPLDAEYVINPDSRQIYKVQWGQDDSGRLVVIDAVAVSQGQVPAGVTPQNAMPTRQGRSGRR